MFHRFSLWVNADHYWVFMLDIKHLKQIIVLSEVGTVTAAADKLHISQPTLTSHINRI
ncbi:MAG: hypothetical protein DRQ47_08425, partial [Gammaproteobacteria bacterium]